MNRNIPFAKALQTTRKRQEEAIGTSRGNVDYGKKVSSD